MDEDEIKKDIERMARASDWSSDLITILLKKYEVTPETLLQRFTNILPHFFDLKDLFFIRLDSTADLIQYHISKELHLSQLHTPYNNELNEHLCHRWISISSIKNIRSRKVDCLIDAQVSEYWQTNKSYFCISIAQPNGFNNTGATSVTLGLMMTEKLKGTFNFIKDPEIKSRKVHTTCERCSMSDCDNRVAPPTFVEKKNRQIELEEELKKL